MEEMFTSLSAGFMLIVGLAVVFAKYFAAPQSYLTEAVKKAAGVPKRYHMLLNLAIGVLLCVAVTVVVSFWIEGGWRLIPAGFFAGILLSQEGGAEYDRQQAREAQEVPEKPPAIPVRRAERRTPE